MITMKFEEVCEELEKPSMPTEADLKAFVEGLLHLLIRLLLSGMSCLLRQVVAHSSVYEKASQLSVGCHLESF